MSAKHRLASAMATRLGRRGLELRRHPAARRQAVMTRLGVDLVLDVGAADGGYGRTLRSFGYLGEIVSFEPQSEPYERLSAGLKGDPRWSARHVGLGREPGAATINVASNSTSSSILPMLEAHLAAAPQITYVGSEEIRVARLDDEAAELAAAASAPFLKIDTQGFEREVLAGAARVVDACVGLQLELSFVPLYSGGMLVDEAVAWAYDRGFYLVVIEQGYASPSGEVLQVDGVFVRDRSALGLEG